MRGCGRVCGHRAWNLRCERGGGSKPQPAQVIPAPPAPDVAKTAGESYEAQLKYNPLLTQQNLDIQKQYAPQFAQSQYDIQAQQAPLYKALMMQLYPQLGTLEGQVGQRLGSPQGLTPEQQAAQDAIRQRAYDQSAQGIRESANVGGTLYGGRRELREDRARNELAQGFATQDIALQDQRRAQSMQELITLLQLSNPGVQQVNVPQYGQSVVPGGDNLYNALVQNQGNFGVIPGTSGTPGVGGALATGAGAALTVKAFMFCLPEHQMIDTSDGPKPIEQLRAGDSIQLPEGPVSLMLKYEFAPALTDFVRLSFDGGETLELCTRHVLDGRLAGTYTSEEVLQGKRIVDVQHSSRVVRTYDLLTDAPDGRYASQGIVIPSMIPLFHKLSTWLQEVS